MDFSTNPSLLENEISQNRRTQPRPAASVGPSGSAGVTGPTMSGFYGRLSVDIQRRRKPVDTDIN
jgi:hypothetical protein